MKPPSEIDPIDAHVGQRLRLARALRGLSQGGLASLEKLTFQQMQKYEKGANRISVSRLYHLAEHLRLPVPWFFQGLPNRSGSGDSYLDLSGEYTSHDNETCRLLRLFCSVEDRNKRKAILSILQSVIKWMG